MTYTCFHMWCQSTVLWICYFCFIQTTWLPPFSLNMKFALIHDIINKAKIRRIIVFQWSVNNQAIWKKKKSSELSTRLNWQNVISIFIQSLSHFPKTVWKWLWGNFLKDFIPFQTIYKCCLISLFMNLKHAHFIALCMKIIS